MPYEKCANAEQANAIEEFKRRIKDELTSTKLLEDDALFYKYLKARDFDIDKAENLLRKHIVWRKVFQVDQILDIFKPKEAWLKYVEPKIIGYDRDGDLVRFTAMGRLNAENWYKCIKGNDNFRHWIWFAEKQKELANKTGKKISLTLIVDLDKFPLATVTSKLTSIDAHRIASMIQDNYAERVKALYVINAPSYFVFFYTILKAILSYTLKKRIHVFGYSGWKEKLFEVIDADILPAFLGGKLTDPDGDPYCRSIITLPGIIPESYYLSDEERYFGNLDDVNTLIIPASEKKEVVVYITKVESSIRWKFMVNKTIRFGLFYEERPKKMKEVIPLYEYHTLDGTEENSYKCFSKGKYILLFDNSHSRFSSKEVQYSVTVVKPDI